MKWIVALLLVTSAAEAQQVLRPGSCSVGSTAWAPASREECDRRGGQFREEGSGLFTVIGGGSVWATSSTPQCPDGYSLVYTGRPMCARDLIEPK